MLKSRLLMQPPIMLRLVMSGVLACSFGANGLRADDGNKVDAPKVELKPLIELKPAGAPPANPLPGIARPPTEFVPSVAVPSPEIPRATLPTLPPKLSTESVPLIDLRPKADLVPAPAPRLTEPAANLLDAAKSPDAPKAEPAPGGVPSVPLVNPLNPDVPLTGVPAVSARARVLLDVDASGQARITVDGREFGALESLLGAQTSATAGEVMFSYGDARAVNVSSRTREVLVEATGLPGWVARIAPNNSAAVRFNPAKTCVDLLTPANNTESVVMRLPDASMAEMGADSSARFDLFRDQSYYVSGSGTVKAQSSEGQTIMLWHQAPLAATTIQARTLERSISEAPRPPLAGGPLPASTDAAGQPRLARLIPTTDVLIAGSFAGGLNLRVGDRTVELNAAKASETVTLPNGSAIEFTMDGANEVLAWRVNKGYFTLRMDGEAFRLWRAVALTDQSGALRWDKSLLPHTIVLKNTTPASPVSANSIMLVDLAKDVPPYNRYFDSPQPGFYASLKPDATFSYSPSETRADENGNKNLRVGASAPNGGVNIYRVFPNIASVVPGSTDAMYNKELLLGTDCFCMEAAPGVGAKTRDLAAVPRGAQVVPGLNPSIPPFSLPPGKFTTPAKFALPPATLGP